MHGTWKT